MSVYLAFIGKFWLRSRISFKESNFGTDKILDAAWKLRSAQRITTRHLSVSNIYNKLREIKYKGQKALRWLEKSCLQVLKNTHSTAT